MDLLDLPPALFDDPPRASGTLHSLHEAFIRSGSRRTLAEFSSSLRGGLLSSPDPEMTLGNFHRFVTASLSSASLFNDMLLYPLYGDLLFRIFGYSQYFADVLVREPGLFRWLTASEALTTPVTGDYLSGEIDRVFSAFQRTEKRLDALKRLHRREVLRIGAQDILGLADLSSATAQLSLLADAIIHAVVRIAVDQLAAKAGVHGQLPFCVIGLGKLGGMELNYSSDIDVMFVYAEDRDGEGQHAGTAHEYFNTLAERIVQNLSQPSSEGSLYRVDTRLRPESGAGPLARSVTGYLTYYESRGELWERQMLLKARPVAGDRSIGEALLRELLPFVHPRSFAEHPAASVARIKARIEAAVGDEANIKLMAGGIRDVEFVSQTLQLLNGATTPALRERTTLRALGLLRAHGLLTADEETKLSSAYVLYRTIEHRLQTMLNTQTHTLPSDARSYAALARRVGLASAEELRLTLANHVAEVRTIFLQVMGGGETAGSADITSVADGGLDEASMIRVLTGFGFRDGRAAARNVRHLTSGSALTEARDLDARARDAFRALAPALFAEMSRTPDPDLTFAALTTLAGGQIIRHAFYAQLSDPRFRRFILGICAISPRFARGLSQQPLLLEWLASDPEARMGDAAPGPHATENPGEFKIRQELCAGVRHVLGFTDFDQFTGELSTTASLIITALLSGRQNAGRRDRAPLAVFGLGKLGTAELGLDADLDLLFVGGGGGRHGHEALEKEGARILRGLTAVSSRGRLYEADVRLRPEGRNAPLVVDAPSYAKYLTARASLWERQSLTRLRFVAGDDVVGAAVAGLVARFVYDSPLPGRWAEEIVGMRRKMETRSRIRPGAFHDVKLGPGGMADIEFAAQMVQLRFGGAIPALRGMKTVEVLRDRSHGAIPTTESELLATAYVMYRRIEFLMRVALEERGSVLPEGERLDRLARLYDGSSGAALESRVGTTMKRVRAVFLDIAAGFR